MDSGRFGPIRPNEKPKKHYKLDYNRFVTFAMVLVIIVLAIIMIKEQMTQKEEGGIITVPTPFAPRVPGVTAEPTLSPEDLRPKPAAEGLLPVFTRANTQEKRIAITVDACADSDALQTLVGLCETFDAKLTFFPTGSELTGNVQVWAMIMLAGHEIENHTYSNAPLAPMTLEVKADEVGAQTSILRSILGAEYQPHFLRTNDAADDADPVLHQYLAQSGYMGIARWALYTPASFDQIQPGQILCYTLNESGMQALSLAIQVLAENGYEIVTLNELFDYPNNIDSTEEAPAGA